MRILIVGGGKLGYYLAKTLTPGKHHLVLVDEDQDVCKKIANELSDRNIEVINGDGTDVVFLGDADIEHADILIAATGYDETNLVACLLAKNYFSVPRTIARVNNPKNINIFKQLGVDSVVSSTALIADIIELEVDWSCLNNMLSQPAGSIRLKEIRVGRHAGVIGKTIAQLSLPAGTMIVALIRDKHLIVPDGQTAIQGGDYMVAIIQSEKTDSIIRQFE